MHYAQIASFLLCLGSPLLVSAESTDGLSPVVRRAKDSSATGTSTGVTPVETDSEFFCALGSATKAIPINVIIPESGSAKRGPNLLVERTRSGLRKEEPLDSPSGEQGDWVEDKARTAIANEANRINIRPSDDQIKDYLVTYKGKTISVGVTGKFYEFGKQRETWAMTGLTGCTGMVILGETGFWAGHWWESAKEDKKENTGPASFLKWNGDKLMERTPAEFKAVAADVLLDDSTSFDTFESLAKVKTDHKDPFGDGAKVETYCMTKDKNKPTAKKPVPDISQEAKYDSKVQVLQAAIEAAIPGLGNYKQTTYIGDKGRERVIVVDYTPWEKSDDSCGGRIARAKVYTMDDEGAVLDKEWTALASQGGDKQKRAAGASACSIKPTSSAASSSVSGKSSAGATSTGTASSKSSGTPSATSSATTLVTSTTTSKSSASSSKATSISNTTTSKKAKATTSSKTTTSKKAKATPNKKGS